MERNENDNGTETDRCEAFAEACEHFVKSWGRVVRPTLLTREVEPLLKSKLAVSHLQEIYSKACDEMKETLLARLQQSFINNEEFSGKMKELDALCKKNQNRKTADESATGSIWRPTGKPADDVQAYGVRAYLEQRDRLRELKAELSTEGKTLKAEVTERRKRILHLANECDSVGNQIRELDLSEDDRNALNNMALMH